MKIGILSMQRIVNHGSFLQSYGLKALIEANGHDVKFIDVIPGEKLLEEKKLRSSTPFYHHFLSKVKHVLFNRAKVKRFYKDYFPISGIDAPIHQIECDMVVIGSDEVFNFYQASPWGLSDQLLGKVNNKVISYAGSFGNTSVEIIEKLNLKDRVAADIANFSAVSVRDLNSYECVKFLTGKAPQVHLDPVLIYDFEKEQKKYSKLKFNHYIAIYCYDNGIKDDKSIKIIKKFAKERNLKIVSLGFYTRWSDYNLICSPFELLAYFKNADYVITDTFHGSVISIKQNRKFVTLVRQHNKNKLSDLLRRFDLENRIIENFDNFQSIICDDIDYARVNAFLKAEQEKAKDYLRENIR